MDCNQNAEQVVDCNQNVEPVVCLTAANAAHAMLANMDMWLKFKVTKKNAKNGIPLLSRSRN